MSKDMIVTMPSNDERFDPVTVIRGFNKSCQDAISRYNSNIECIHMRDQDTQDILHEIELSGSKNAREGYKLYRKLKLVREDRRRAKNENEVLEPLVQWLQANKQFQNQLAQIQGKCGSKQQVIANRKYSPRGNILEN